MMAAILNSAILDSDTAIMDSDTLFTQKHLLHSDSLMLIQLFMMAAILNSATGFSHSAQNSDSDSN